MKVLITGGAGYIGSHVVFELLEAEIDFLVYDNCSNSSPNIIKALEAHFSKQIHFVRGDIRDRAKVKLLFAEFKPDLVIHFAGLKSIAESWENPLDYYTQNLTGLLNILEAMNENGCKQIVYSSSATVYGEAKYLPYDENHPVSPENPYGRTKLFGEQILSDWSASVKDSSCVVLRYFNPVGAHETGVIGEAPKGEPNNLMPKICEAAMDSERKLYVYGNDFPTRDGTGERDYIHVVDLAKAHTAAIALTSRQLGYEILNVGTGSGVTVLELIRSFERITARELRYELRDRRPGDVPTSVANVSKSERVLKWKSVHGIESMCRSAWHWQLTKHSAERT